MTVVIVVAVVIVVTRIQFRYSPDIFTLSALRVTPCPRRPAGAKSLQGVRIRLQPSIGNTSCPV